MRKRLCGTARREHAQAGVPSETLDSMPDFERGAHRVMVLEDPDLSEGIVGATGIDHESPQVILFYQGEAVWNASHLSIDRAAMRTALSAIGR